MRIIKKKLLIVTIFIVIALSVISCGSKEEDYRQIQVYKIDGTATVARAGSSMDVYENMQLQSGDVVETVGNSYLQLKLDEDKYILLEPDTKISLQATGNSVDSNTAIFLEKGAIVNQLDNPLSEDSNYQVTTPNSTMAVRGTTFRVEITYDENGESFAKVAVYGGKVECMLVFPDGSVKEPVMVEGGTEVLVRGDDVESEYVMSGTTSYEELREKVLEFLEVAIERGEELSISQEEIEVLIEAQQALEEGEAEIEEVPEKELAEEETTEDVVEEGLEEKNEENQLQETLQEEIEEETEEEEKEETQQPTTTPDSSAGGGTSTGGSETTSGGSSSSGTASSQYDVKLIFAINDEMPFAEKTVKADIGKDSVSIGGLPLLKPTQYGNWIYIYEKESTGEESTGGDSADGENPEVIVEEVEVGANASLPIVVGQTEVTIYWTGAE